MLHFNLCFYTDSPRASAMLCPSLAREGRNVRFADVGVSTKKYDNKLFSLLSLNYPECHAEFILASPSAIARLHLPRPHDPIVWFIYLFPTQYNHAAAGRHSGMSGKCSNASEMCSNVSEMCSSVSEMRSSASEMRSNVSEMCSNASEMRSNVSEMCSSASEMCSNVSEMCSSVSEMRSSVSEMRSNVSEMCSNASEMCSGMSESGEGRDSISSKRWNPLEVFTKLCLASGMYEMCSNASEMCSGISESGEGRDSISSKRWNPLEVFMKLCLASGITRCVPACPNPGRDSLTPTSANRTFRPSLARQGQSIADARGVSVWGGIPSLQKMESIKKSDALTIVANKQLPSRNL